MLNACFLVGNCRLIQVPIFYLPRKGGVLRARFQQISMIFCVVFVFADALRVRKADRPIT